MRWKKLGFVYSPSGEVSWKQSHAYIPTPYMLDEERIRLYVAFWDEQKIGRLGYVDVLAKNPQEVLAVSKEPVLDIGAPGCFDDCGVSPAQVIESGQELLMYYIGWQKTIKARYLLFAGLASSRDRGESFQRVSQAPILDRRDDERFVRSAMTLFPEKGGYRAIYVSGDKWIQNGEKEVPTYCLKQTVSADGRYWSGPSESVVELDHQAGEIGFGRPWVINDGGTYKLWYSIRSWGKNYRMGYAESKNGVDWVRKDDEVGILTSETGWDSEMICFPATIDTKYGRYMFFNGNNYGETGFGVAISES